MRYRYEAHVGFTQDSALSGKFISIVANDEIKFKVLTLRTY